MPYMIQGVRLGFRAVLGPRQAESWCGRFPNKGGESACWLASARADALEAVAQDVYKIQNVRQGGIVMEVAIMLAVGLAVLIGIIVLVSQS